MVELDFSSVGEYIEKCPKLATLDIRGAIDILPLCQWEVFCFPCLLAFLGYGFVLLYS